MAADSGPSRRHPAATYRLADRARLLRAAAMAVTGIGQPRVRRVRWDRAATVRTRAATGVDHPPVRSWICGSRLYGLPLTAGICAGLTAGIAVPRATAGRGLAQTTRRPPGGPAPGGRT